MKPSPSGSFGPVLHAFFLERLVAQRNASPRTVAAYRDSFRLLLQFAQQQLGKAPKASICRTSMRRWSWRSSIIWSARATTRFAAAMRGSRRFDPSRILPRSRSPPPAEPPACPRDSDEAVRQAVAGFLSKDEMQAILDAPPADRWSGQRDRIMFATLYNTGARVSELTGLRVGRCRPGRQRLRAAPRQRTKDRSVPLWRTTTTSCDMAATDRQPTRPAALPQHQRAGV